MSKNFEIQGLIHSIGTTTEYGSNGFTKREFVIKLTGEDENPAYPNHLALELIKDKCAMMDSYNVGDEINVRFNLSGRLWQGSGKPERCFTSLQAWKVEPVQSGRNADVDPSMPEPPEGFADYDDMPF
ncbi:MAG: DUF3127 domain-containing protein [Deltaproteobacteria bacterium]|nr:DUF3127 domain-containing protein [Deltaproteobacteria bacterium]MBN2673740.1 DUF3127 domain-containing protein [Deltaproteobacteria bacterium]